MNTQSQPYDVAICGAGPIGFSLALQLAQRGMAPGRIALVDARPLDLAVQDPRSIALSHGSRLILEGVDCWTFPCDPISEIHVSRRGHFGRTLMQASEFNLPALGYVVRYGEVVRALAAAAASRGIVALRPMHASSSAERADTVEIRFSDGSHIFTHLMVQAEGGVFAEQDAKARHRDYEQTAIVAHVRVSAPIALRAFERFTDEGPLALLPQDGGYSLVWCMRPETAARMQLLADAAFLAELQTMFGNRVGRFHAVSTRHAFPLGLNAYAGARERTVAIGNAAQTLHPVAGQGLNLGLRDAVELARLIAGKPSPDAIARFEQLRGTDRKVTIGATDFLARIFVGRRGPLQSVLGLSLGLMDTIAPARRLLAEHMMYGHR